MSNVTMKTHPKDWQVSNETRRKNPHIYGNPVGAVEAQKPEPVAPQALDRGTKELPTSPPIPWQRRNPAPKRKTSHTPQVAVTFVAYRRRLIDSDNNVGSMKPIRDALAKWIGMDDGDPRWRWECAQVLTRGAEGVAVKIDW